MRCSDFAERRDNNFDVLRLAAASLVLISHSWALCNRTEPVVLGDTLGALGVTVFFAISGFLVARSWDRDPRAHAFVAKRALRIWPALIAVVVLCAAMLGPAVTALPLGSYFGVEPARYVGLNLGLHTWYELPGVFASNPHTHAVNGSLWTLPVEVKAYALVLALGLAGLLRRPLALLALLSALLYGLSLDGRPNEGIVFGWLGDALSTRFVIVFAGAALLYALREHVPLDWRAAAVAVLVLVVMAGSAPVPRAAAWAIAAPYVVLCLAYRTPSGLRRMASHGDVSYGIYLWAFPVQQALILAMGKGAAPGWVLLGSALITYAVALASWRLVEAPALRLRSAIAGKPG